MAAGPSEVVSATLYAAFLAVTLAAVMMAGWPSFVSTRRGLVATALRVLFVVAVGGELARMVACRVAPGMGYTEPHAGCATLNMLIPTILYGYPDREVEIKTPGVVQSTYYYSSAPVITSKLQLPNTTLSACRYDLYGAHADPELVPCDSPFLCFFKTAGEKRYRELVTPVLHPGEDSTTFPLYGDAAAAVATTSPSVFVYDANWVFMRQQLASNHDCMAWIEQQWLKSKDKDERDVFKHAATQKLQEVAALATMFNKTFVAIEAEAPACMAHARNLRGDVVTNTLVSYRATFDHTPTVGPAILEAVFNLTRAAHYSKSALEALVRCDKAGVRLAECPQIRPIDVERWCVTELKVEKKSDDEQAKPDAPEPKA